MNKTKERGFQGDKRARRSATAATTAAASETDDACRGHSVMRPRRPRATPP